MLQQRPQQRAPPPPPHAPPPPQPWPPPPQPWPPPRSFAWQLWPPPRPAAWPAGQQLLPSSHARRAASPPCHWAAPLRRRRRECAREDGAQTTASASVACSRPGKPAGLLAVDQASHVSQSEPQQHRSRRAPQSSGTVGAGVSGRTSGLTYDWRRFLAHAAAQLASGRGCVGCFAWEHHARRVRLDLRPTPWLPPTVMRPQPLLQQSPPPPSLPLQPKHPPPSWPEPLQALACLGRCRQYGPKRAPPHPAAVAAAARPHQAAVVAVVAAAASPQRVRATCHHGA